MIYLENKKMKETSSGKKSDNRKKIITTVSLSVIIIVFLALVLVGLSQLTGFSIFDERSPAVVSENGSFFAVNPDKVSDIKSYRNGIALVTDDKLSFIDSSGRQYRNFEHSYANPVLVVNEKNAMLFDRGGTSFLITANSREVVADNFESAVICAALSADSRYAYCINEHSGFQSHIFVYDFNGKELFNWGSPSDYCLAMTLSANKKYLAVSLLGSDNAELYSTVCIFDLNKKVQICSAVLKEATVVELSFSGNDLYALSDCGLFRIDTDGSSESVQEYTSTEIGHYQNCISGLKCASVSLFGNEQNSLVTVYDKKFRKQFDCSYESNVSAVAADKSSVCIVLENRFEVFSKKQELIGEVGLGEFCKICVLNGKNIYILTVSGLYKYNTNDKLDIDILERNKQASEKDEGNSDNGEFTTEAESQYTAVTDENTDEEMEVNDEEIINTSGNSDEADITDASGEESDLTENSDDKTVSEPEFG